MELKITKEKVLETVKNIPGSESVLKSLFPEAFTPFKKGDWIIRTWISNGETDIARVSGDYETDFFIRFNKYNMIYIDHSINISSWKNNGCGPWQNNDPRVTPFKVMTEEDMKEWAHLVLPHLK